MNLKFWYFFLEKDDIKNDLLELDMCVVQDLDSIQGKGLPMESVHQEVKTAKEDDNASVVDSESESENSSSDEFENTKQTERGKSTEKTKIVKDSKAVESEHKKEDK